LVVAGAFSCLQHANERLLLQVPLLFTV